MPGNILNTDIMYPNLRGKDTEQQISSIMSYLYMLREQLRYSMANLGVENINPTSLNEIGEIITEPVYVRLEDTEGNVNKLMVDVNNLSSQLSDAEGNISTLQQTANSLTGRVTDAEGNISTLQQTSQSLSSEISSLDGTVSTLSQTVNGMTLSVSNGSQTSTISLVRNGVAVSSQTISMSGMVVFSDLETSGQSIITGDNIKTGTISAINISGCLISGSIFKTTLSSSGGVGGEIKFYYISDATESTLAGGMRLDNQGEGSTVESTYRLIIYTNNVLGVPFALKLQSAGNMSLESARNIYLSGTYINLTGTVNITGTLSVNGIPVS